MPRTAGAFAFAAAALLIVICSCKTKRAKAALPANSNMAPFIHFEYAVYLPTARSTPQARPMQVLGELLREHPNLKPVSELPKEPQAMFVDGHLNEDIQKGYSPPRLEALKHSGHGLSPEQEASLQKSTQALVLDFAHPRRDVWTGLRIANTLVEEVARRTKGFVWDEETREVFTADAWREQRLEQWTRDIPRVSDQTVIHTYDTGHSVRAISLGMSKMGLPDLIVEDMVWSSLSQVGHLVNLVGQAMAEGESAQKSGQFHLVLRMIRNAEMREQMLNSLKANATQDGCLTFLPGRWEEGDPHNRLLQLSFDKYPGKDALTKQETMVGSFFGWDDPVRHIKHTAELLAASAEAKKQIPALQKALASGMQPGEYIEVKVPFKTTSGGTEWMWVEIRKWDGPWIRGLLDSEPEAVEDRHAGQEVEVRQEDIFDYIHVFPDKRIEGNTTGAIIKRMEENEKSVSSNVQPVVPTCGG